MLVQFSDFFCMCILRGAQHRIVFCLLLRHSALLGCDLSGNPFALADLEAVPVIPRDEQRERRQEAGEDLDARHFLLFV